eukprot:6196960-Pleurochrysis_carterae.AAC.2
MGGLAQWPCLIGMNAATSPYGYTYGRMHALALHLQMYDAMYNIYFGAILLFRRETHSSRASCIASAAKPLSRKSKQDYPNIKKCISKIAYDSSECKRTRSCSQLQIFLVVPRCETIYKNRDPFSRTQAASNGSLGCCKVPSNAF